MGNRALTAAFWDYDRTRPLADGRVTLSGYDLRVTFSTPEVTFARAASAEFHVSELSLSNSATRLSEGRIDYTLLPVFLSRAFRHSAIFIRSDRGIVTPADLRGRTIGVQEYDMTAAVVVRGLLRDEFGVQPTDIRWRVGETGGGAIPTFPGGMPSGLAIDVLAPGASLEARLVAGELDGIIALRPSATLMRGAGVVRRLFADPRAAEEQWLKEEGFFPIMHVVGVRRELLLADSNLAIALYEAFDAAKRLAIAELDILQAPKVTLPWPHLMVADVRDLMGEDFWPYGVASNRRALETQLRWLWLDGLLARRLTVDDLFASDFRVPLNQ